MLCAAAHAITSVLAAQCWRGETRGGELKGELEAELGWDLGWARGTTPNETALAAKPPKPRSKRTATLPLRVIAWEGDKQG